MSNIQLTQELVKSLFDYRDGFLYWKISRTVRIKVGDLAGTENPGKHGKRRKIGVYPFRPLYASRLIYLWHYGELPDFIDHKDRNPENNKIENLRKATKSENCKNCNPVKNSSSKYLNVSYHKQNKKWQANGTLSGKKVYLGLYDLENDAAKAANEFAIKYYGDFANLNVIM